MCFLFSKFLKIPEFQQLPLVTLEKELDVLDDNNPHKNLV